MKLQEFLDNNNNKKVDFDGHYGAQCVDLFRCFNRDVLGIAQPRGVNGAKDFWTNYPNDPNLYNNFERIANTPDFVPQFGDIAVWGNGTYGHIAICTGKGDVRTFESFDQNYPTGSACHYVKHNYSGFYGVFRPKNQENIVSYFNVRVDKAEANVRKQPKLSAPLAGSKVLYKGDVFKAVGTVKGDNVNGNDIWYHSKVGNYVHSRGLTRI